MQTKVLVLTLVILTQVLGPLTAQTLAPEPSHSPGIVQTLVHKARDAKAKVQGFGATAMGFLGSYYEEHVQPVTSSYGHWASDVGSSMWEKIRSSVGSYSPFSGAANATDDAQ